VSGTADFVQFINRFYKLHGFTHDPSRGHRSHSHASAGLSCCDGDWAATVGQDHLGACHQIDLLIDQAGTLTPFEIKSGMTLNRDYFTSLQRWSALAGSQAGEPVLIYGGTEGQQRTDARVVGWQQVKELA
jgi:hypothetical protein